MVVFWEEDSGAETSSPSPPTFTFFDDPNVPIDPPDTPPAPPGRQIHLDFHQDGPQLLHLLVEEKE